MFEQVAMTCGHLDGELWAPGMEWREDGAYLEALGLNTLHMGHVLVACWIEPTA